MKLRRARVYNPMRWTSCLTYLVVIAVRLVIFRNEVEGTGFDTHLGEA